MDPAASLGLGSCLWGQPHEKAAGTDRDAFAPQKPAVSFSVCVRFLSCRTYGGGLERKPLSGVFGAASLSNALFYRAFGNGTAFHGNR